MPSATVAPDLNQMSGNRPKYRMGLRVNEATGEYDQVDVFSMITAAMASCLIENAFQARAAAMTNELSESLDGVASTGARNKKIQAPDDTCLSRENQIIVSETVTMTRDEINQLATKIAEELIEKRDAALISKKSSPQGHRKIMPKLWICCNCLNSGMDITSSTARLNCGHYMCHFCELYKYKARFEALEEKDDED